MRARGLVLFILLNVIISLGVAYLVIQFLDTGSQQDPEFQRFATVIVQITTTPLPPEIIIVTATPREGEIASIPTGVLDEITPSPTASPEVASSLSDEQLTDNPELQGTVAALPQGCIVHTLQEGESPGGLAVTYDVLTEDILAVNNLTEDDARFLQIGQVLTIPLEGCSLLPEEGEEETTADETGDGTESTEEGDSDAEGTPEAEITSTPTVTPTITLAPTAVDAQVEIIEVVGAGDVTIEAVIIFNNGRTVSLNGWTLSDLDGNEYTFGDQRLFNDASLEIFSGVGADTAPRKFWGLTEPVWNAGDVVTLRDAEGNIQSILRIPDAQ